MSTNQTPPISEPITDAQKAKWEQIWNDLLRKHGGNKRRLQRIIGNPNFVPTVVGAMNDCGLGDEFAGEKVEPNSEYDYDIRALPGSDEQIAKQMVAMQLKGVVEVIRFTVQENLHPEADGFGAVPSITDLGKIWGIDDPLGEGFGQVLEKILRFMRDQRGCAFRNSREGELTKDHVRLFWRTKMAWQQLEALVPAENGRVRFFVIPINSGKKYQGFSYRNARTDAFDIDALPLDPVSVTALLLSWPERLEHQFKVMVHCSGAEYSWNADGKWSWGCIFRFDQNRFDDSALIFDACLIRDTLSGCCGTAVAFPGVLQVAD